MIIIIVVVVMLGVYEVGNSVAFNKRKRAVPGRHKDLNIIIMNTYDDSFKREQIDYFDEYRL